MADFRQDIKTEFVHLAGALMEHFLEGNAPLRLCVSKFRKEDLYLLLFSFGLMYYNV